MKSTLAKLFSNEHLSANDIQIVMEKSLQGEATDAEIAAFLTGLRMKGETAEEIAAIASMISSQSSMSDLALSNTIDNCGTGGDRSYSFNISTTAAFVLAGAGLTVAKHGNRSISSKTGSADVLEHLGVSLHFSKAETEYLLRENKITFLFAPHVHEHLRSFMKVRKDLGLPTIFNLIGPLTNPIALDSQLMGVYQADKLETIAEALNKLGRKRAVVLHGAGGMDEASLSGKNELVLLNEGHITSFTITGEDVGLPHYDNEAIRGGDTKRNAEILLSVLQNEAGPYLDTVLFNAGIGLFTNGAANTIKDGIAVARETIQSGKALARLEYLIAFSKNREKEVVQ